MLQHNLTCCPFISLIHPGCSRNIKLELNSLNNIRHIHLFHIPFTGSFAAYTANTKMEVTEIASNSKRNYMIAIKQARNPWTSSKWDTRALCRQISEWVIEWVSEWTEAEGRCISFHSIETYIFLMNHKLTHSFDIWIKRLIIKINLLWDNLKIKIFR